MNDSIFDMVNGFVQEPYKGFNICVKRTGNQSYLGVATINDWKFFYDSETIEGAMKGVQEKVDEFLECSPKTWRQLADAINEYASDGGDDYYIMDDKLERFVKKFVKENSNLFNEVESLTVTLTPCN